MWCTVQVRVLRSVLKHVLFECDINCAYVQRVKLYYFINIEMHVGVRIFDLLKHYTDLQQTKYMLGLVDIALFIFTN